MSSKKLKLLSPANVPKEFKEVQEKIQEYSKKVEIITSEKINLADEELNYASKVDEATDVIKDYSSLRKEISLAEQSYNSRIKRNTNILTALGLSIAVLATAYLANSTMTNKNEFDKTPLGIQHKTELNLLSNLKGAYSDMNNANIHFMEAQYISIKNSNINSEKTNELSDKLYEATNEISPNLNALIAGQTERIEKLKQEPEFVEYQKKQSNNSYFFIASFALGIIITASGRIIKAHFNSKSNTLRVELAADASNIHNKYLANQ